MVRKACASLFAASAIAFGVGIPAASAQPVVTGGLVNVTVTNLLNNNTTTVTVPVGVALNIAANVCGVSVGVLANQLGSMPVSCQNASQTASALITR